eukprot:scaffold1598_cov105-Pinguiococcus_pyrenoidosus.AAC.1
MAGKATGGRRNNLEICQRYGKNPILAGNGKWPERTGKDLARKAKAKNTSFASASEPCRSWRRLRIHAKSAALSKD